MKATFLGAWVLMATLAPTAAWSTPCKLWSQSRCDAANRASIELDTRDGPAARAWTFDGSGRVWGYEPGLTVWSSPSLAVAQGVPVVAAGNYDHTVYGLHAATGEVLWKLTTGGPVYAAPVFFDRAGQTVLFAASNDRIVYAVDASSGRQIWVHAVEDYRPTLGGARLASGAIGATGDHEDAIFVPYWIWDRSLVPRPLSLATRRYPSCWGSNPAR